MSTRAAVLALIAIVLMICAGWQHQAALKAERDAAIVQRDAGAADLRALRAQVATQNARVDAIAADCIVRDAQASRRAQVIIRAARPPPQASADADSINAWMRQLRGQP